MNILLHPVIYFNSIKVRLEHCSVATYDNYRTFQFHKGTIRTKHYDGMKVYFIDFNSIKVRLERFIAEKS